MSKISIIMPSYNHERFSSWPILIIALISATIAVYAVKDPWLSPDSIRYANVSGQILSGAGLRTQIFRINENPDAAGTVPFVIQPPLYPIMLAAFGGVNSQRVWPGQLINVLALITISVLCFIMTRRIAGPLAGAMVGVAIPIYWPIVKATLFIWSDLPFLAFIMLSLTFLQLSRCRSRGLLLVVASGLFAAMAVATRFAGIALIPVFIFEAAIRWRRKNFRAAIRLFVLSALPAILCAAVLMIRNHLLSGQVRGFSQPDAERSMISALLEILYVCAAKQRGWKMVGFYLAAMIPSIPFLIHCLKRDVLRRLCDNGLDIVLFAFISYLALMIFAMMRYQPRFESRFSCPLIALGLILWATTISHGWKRLFIFKARINAYRVACCGMYMAIVAVLGFGTSYLGKWFLRPQPGMANLANTALFRAISNTSPPGTIVATNSGFSFTFFTNCSSLWLPTRSHNNKTIIPPDLESFLPDRMRQIGAKHIILFCAPGGLSEKNWGTYISALSRRITNDRSFELLFSDDSGVVYELKSPLSESENALINTAKP